MARTPRPKSLGLLRAAFLILPCALLLAACSSTPISDERFRGLPEGVEDEQQLDSPLVQWKNKPKSITVTTWGSSSCPPDAIDMELGAENNLTIHFESETEGACTADLSPTTHVLTLPDDAQHSPLTVKISIDGTTSPDEHVLR